MNPRIGLVFHPEYPVGGESADAFASRIRAEFAKIAALGFGALRLHTNADVILTTDRAGISGYGMNALKVWLVEAKAQGFSVFLTLPEPNGWFDQTVMAHKAVMEASAAIFADTPNKLSWCIQNEPETWAKWQYSAFTHDLAKEDIKHWDSTGLRDKGLFLYGATLAGWHFKPDPGYELAENVRFVRDRHLQNRLGFLQRTGSCPVVYVGPGDAPRLAKLKVDALVSLIRTELVSHPIVVPEVGVRWDLFETTLTQYMMGKTTGQVLKAVASNPEVSCSFLYDWNGGNALSLKGRSRFIDGVRAGLK